MKYKILIIITIIAIIGIFYLFFVICTKHPEIKTYSVLSDNGTQIPAKLYSREVISIMDGNEVSLKEIILCFDDSLVHNKLNAKGDEKLYKFLVIIPQYKTIGLINNINSIKVREGYLCQSSDDANKFTSIIDNRTFYKNPPIKEAQFEDKRVIFNTYGILREFGNSIIISY